MFKTLTHLAWIGFIILITPFLTFGQKNFQQGFIVLPSNDSISGLIDDQEWAKNPKVIFFKNNSDSEAQPYNVNQLNGFGINNGDNYHKAILQIDKSPVQFELLTPNSKPVITADTVFLLEQVKGIVSLYHLLDENGKNHFFINKNNGPLEELIQRRYVLYRNEQRLAGISDQYKDQLLYSYLTECIAIKHQIARASYTTSSLKSVIEKYNFCSEPGSPTKVKTISKHKSKIGLVAGLNLTNYKFISSKFDYLTKADFNYQLSPMFGLTYELVLPRNRQKWSIYNELAWKRNQSEGYFYLQESNYTAKGKIQIQANYLGLTTMVRYSWVNKSLQPFINAGLAGNMAYSITNHLVSQEQVGSKQETGNRKILEHADKFEPAFVVGGGVKMKKISAEARLEKGKGYLNNYAEISVRKVMPVFLLGLSFN